MIETADIVITVENRETQGSNQAGRLRREGRVPAVLYGGGMDPVAISVAEKAIQELLRSETGENTIFLLKLAGSDQERRAMIKDIQLDPISKRIEHIDFIRVMKGHKLSVTIPVELTGDCVGVRHGGMIDFVSRELDVEVLPREMFDKITVDISGLEVGHHVAVGDLVDQLPPSARFLEDSGRVVVLVGQPRGPKFEEEEGEQLGEAEGERVIGEQEEPELIRSRGKGDED